LRATSRTRRALRKSAGFSISAIVLLATGIGGTAVIFSVTDTLLLRSLPVAPPGELVRIVNIIPPRPPVSVFSYFEFEEWRARTRSVIATFAEADTDASLQDAAGSPHTLRSRVCRLLHRARH
jgi:hypothetical protein